MPEWHFLLYMNSWPGYKHYFHLQLHIYFVDIGIKQKVRNAGAPTLLYTPWTYERVGRYSHGCITSYKLNFSSSPLFNLLQYFLQNSFLKCPRVKSVCEDFISTLFPQNYFWLKVFCFMFFWLENWKHKYAYGLRKNSVTMCDQWNIILSSTPCIQKQLRCVHVVFLQI